jgi:hypothetical protein
MIYLTDILQLVKIFQVLRNSNRGDSVKIHTNFTMKNKVLQALKINSSGSKVKKERIILLYNRRMLYTYVHIHIYIYIYYQLLYVNSIVNFIICSRFLEIKFIQIFSKIILK